MVKLTPSQRELLSSIPNRFQLDRIDRLWIFSPFVAKTRESGLFVVSLISDDSTEDSQRTLFTVRYQIEAGTPQQRTESIVEEGRAPSDRIERIIQGVIARSGEEATDPIAIEIDGREERWIELLAQLSDAA